MQVKQLAATMIAGVATLASASAFADFDMEGLYILGGVGVAGIENSGFADSDDVTSVDGVAVAPGYASEAEFAWQGAIGVWLTDNFALQANYIGITNEGDHKDVGGNHFNIDIDDSYYVDISGLGRCDFDDNLWGYARLGVAWAGNKRTETFTDSDNDFTINTHSDEGGLGAAIGIGAQYDFTEMFGLRLEASTVQALNDNDMYAATASVVVNFGELM